MEGRRPAGRRPVDPAGVPLTRQQKRCAEEEQIRSDAVERQHSQGGASAGFEGVVWSAAASKWEAQITDGSKLRFLGYFETELEAARMHDAAALKLQGSQARLNFPSRAAGTERHLESEALSKLLSPLQKGTSQFRGVSWNAAAAKWRAQLCHGEAVHHLGYFDSEVEAAHEYDRKALAVRGPAAATNFPAAEYAGGRGQGQRAAPVQPESRFLGVTWDASAGRWAAELWDGQRYKLIGTFEAEHAAAAAYDGACRGMYGLEALLNFSAPRACGRPEAELELAAMEALASMSSSLEDGTHFDISPPAGPAKAAGAATSPRRRAAAARRQTPEATAATLQPTPSPYQGSNCDFPEAQPADAGARLSVAAGPAEGGRSSRFRGVSWHRNSQKWYAYVMQGKTMRGLGYFGTQEQAAAAYDAEALRLHGSKAELNLPREGSATAGPSSGAQAAAGPPVTRQAAQLREGIRWNPADQLYHVFIWDKPAECLRSCGGFKSKAAAVSALHRDGGALLDAARLQAGGSGSEAPPAAAQFSRCDSFTAAGTASPFSRAAMQRSDTADGSLQQASHFERASSISSPLKPPAAAAIGPHTRQQGPVQTLHGMPAIPPRARRPGLRQRPQDSDDSCSGVVGNSWGQASDAAADEGAADGSVYGEEGGSAVEDAPPPSSRSGSPQPQSQGRKRARVPAKAAARPPARGSSKYKGVSWSERSCKWRAQMWFGNKVHHLGFFDTEEAAASCYDAAVLQLRGPAAATNFLPDERAGKENTLKPSVLQSLTAASLPKVTSRYRGVRWHYCNSKWEARIFDGQRQVSLGYFDDEAAAAAAYDQRARALRGLAAVVNFPDGAPRQEAAAAAPPVFKAPSRRPPSGRKRERDDAEYLPELPTRWGATRRRQ